MAKTAWWGKPQQQTDWMDGALCAEVGGDYHFPEVGANHDVKVAKKICGQCTVQRECLSYALSYSGILGVWGGTTEGERRRMRRRREAWAS